VANSLRKSSNPHRTGISAVSGRPYPEYTYVVKSGSNYLKYFNYFEGGIFRVRVHSRVESREALAWALER
jgi:hypothetical protein